MALRKNIIFKFIVLNWFLFCMINIVPLEASDLQEETIVFALKDSQFTEQSSLMGGEQVNCSSGVIPLEKTVVTFAYPILLATSGWQIALSFLSQNSDENALSSAVMNTMAIFAIPLSQYALSIHMSKYRDFDYSDYFSEYWNYLRCCRNLTLLGLAFVASAPAWIYFLTSNGGALVANEVISTFGGLLSIIFLTFIYRSNYSSYMKNRHC